MDMQFVLNRKVLFLFLLCKVVDMPIIDVLHLKTEIKRDITRTGISLKGSETI
jgi:hypothetical protein